MNIQSLTAFVDAETAYEDALARIDAAHAEVTIARTKCESDRERMRVLLAEAVLLPGFIPDACCAEKRDALITRWKDCNRDYRARYLRYMTHRVELDKARHALRRAENDRALAYARMAHATAQLGAA